MGKRGDFLEYQESVRALSEKNIKNDYLANIEFRSQDFHVDHKLSILDAFNENVPVECVADICNLIIVTKEYNLSKGSKSSITFAELMEEITDREYFLEDL